MAHSIAEVEPGSIADQLGIHPGDALIAINSERIVDFVDYQSLSAQEGIELSLQRGDEVLNFVFEKDEAEGLGLVFQEPLMSPLRNCANQCVFCFVDQLPACARPSMKIKDDDWRTSLLMGSFVTLTNVGKRELQRIIKRGASPLYISVHATDDALRKRLLGTGVGSPILDQLRALQEGGIRFHTQVVLCLGLNDGAQLEKTIEDLSKLYPACQSLALVPVGLTAHREGLFPITPYDRQGATAALDICHRWRERLTAQIGSPFVHAADELYILAGRTFPEDDGYEDYPQLDNGVGLCRLLQTEFHWAYENADLRAARPGRIAIACGTSVAYFLETLIREHPINGVQASVHPLTNGFFGPTVTVSGLLTGGDILKGMWGVACDRILITESMLRDGEDVFLDDMRLCELQSALGVPVIPVGRTGEALLNALCGAQVI